MSESYSRLYHRFPTEFPEIWADERAFGSWTKLLMLADASWPIRPPLPRSVRAPVLAKLRDAGLLAVEGDTYIVRGLDAERTRRRDAAAVGAAKRWHSDGNANALPRRERDEKSKDENDSPPPPAERGRRANGTNLRANGHAPRDQHTNPRANGTSVRQERKRLKTGRVGPNVAAILRAANAGEVAK